MPAPPLIEDRLEAEQLRRRIEALERENDTLREQQSPAAGPLELQAENILLRREAEMLRAALAEVTPFEGPLPRTLGELADLPAAHRRQVVREHPDHVRALGDADALVRRAERAGRVEDRRRAVLAEAGLEGPEAFAALPARRRRELLTAMTPEQRRALLGLPEDAKRGPGYL